MTKTFTKIDFTQALEEVSPKVKKAFELSHEALKSAKIAHVVIGGLAVNAYGHHYSTKDVDYLVDEKDAFTGDIIISHKEGVPFKANGVDIDYITEKEEFPRGVKEAMRENIELARQQADKTGVVEDWLLVWMKLNAGRNKDLAGVEGLIQAGLDVESVREQLEKVGPQRIVDLFDRCVKNAG